MLQLKQNFEKQHTGRHLQDAPVNRQFEQQNCSLT